MKIGNRRWVYLIVGVISMLFAGVIYAWSILKAPLGADLGWNSSQLALNFTITMGMFCIGGILGSLIPKKLGITLTMILAGCLSGVGFVLTSFLSSEQLGLLYITFGVMGGLGIGIVYNILVTTLNAWFPDKKGLCSGSLMLGFGFSTLALGTVCNHLFQSVGWRTTYLGLGIAVGIVLVIAGLIIKKTDASFDRAYAQWSRAQEIQNPGKGAVSAKSFSPKEMLKSSLFWRAFLFIMFMTVVGNCVASFAKDISLFTGASDNLATTMVGVFAVCNGICRIIIGILFDTAGKRTTMILCSILAIVTSLVLIGTAITKSLPLCVIGLCLSGLTLGTCPTVGAVIARLLFGDRYYPTNYSIINCNLLFASFMATFASGLVSTTGGYLAPFLIFLVLSIAGLILNLSINKKETTT